MTINVSALSFLERHIVVYQHCSVAKSSKPFWHSHYHAFPLRVGGKSGADLTAKLINGKKVAVHGASYLGLLFWVC